MNLLSNQVEPNFDESYDYRNPKLFQSQRSPSPKKESEEKDIPTEKTQQVINGIISDIAFGAIEAQKDSKSAKKTLTHLQISDTPKKKRPAKKLEAGKMLVHPINLLVSKMAFLYSCTYKTKLENLGWRFDTSNYA